MRRILIAAGIACACALVPATAGAAMPMAIGSLHKYPMREMCQLKKLPAHPATTIAGMKAQCADKQLVKYTPRNVVYGGCGYSWAFNLAWFPGHMVTQEGIHLNAGLWYGSALIGHNNLSNGRHSQEWDAVVRNYDWQTWTGGRGWYTMGGWIRGWMSGSAYNDNAVLCYTPPGQPQDYLWVP